MVVPANADHRLAAKAGFGKQPSTDPAERRPARLQGRQEIGADTDKPDQFLRPLSLVDREILCARCERMVGGSFAAEAKGGQILLSQRVHAAVEGEVEVESVGELSLKGISRPVPAVNVTLLVLEKSNVVGVELVKLIVFA